MNPTHDWHIADGMELMIRRDESDSVGVMLGHENIDDAHSTLIITSRLLEMIDTVQPGAVRAYLAEQEPTDAEVEAACAGYYDGATGLPSWARLAERNPKLADVYRKATRAALTAAREATR